VDRWLVGTSIPQGILEEDNILGLGFLVAVVALNLGTVYISVRTILGIPLPTLNAYFIGSLECFGGLLLIIAQV
jgi:hypothetical protein